MTAISPAQRRTALVLGLLLLFAACSLPWVGLWRPGGVADTGLYGLYGRNVVDGLVPYRDFYLEFPPGALPALVLPALPGSHYVAWFHVLEFLFACGTVACLVLIASRVAPSPRRLYAAVALAAVAPAFLGPITLNSFDFWPTLLTTASVATLLAGHRRSGFALLGAATAAKLFPAGLIAVALLYVLRRDRRSGWWDVLAVYVGTVLLIFAPFAVLGPGGLRFSLRTQLDRGLQLESLGASFFTVAHHLGAYRPSYTPNLPYAQLAGPVAAAVADLSSVAVIGAIVLVAWAYARTRDDGATAFVLAVTATLVGIVTFAKVLSPQYLVWLVPLVAAVSSRGRLAGVLMVAALALTQVWVPDRFRGLQAMDWVTWVLLARNLLLVALFAVLVAELRARARAAAGAATPEARRAPRPWRRPATPAAPDRTA